MPRPTAAETSRAYAEVAEATSPVTAEMLVNTVMNAPWDDLVTRDHLDARFAEIGVRFAESDARHERSMRNFAVWIVTAMFTFNGALAAWFTAVH